MNHEVFITQKIRFKCKLLISGKVIKIIFVKMGRLKYTQKEH
jgi:hypothetical protein